MQVIPERAKYLQVLEQLAPLAQQAQGEGMATRVHALAEGVRTGELLIPVVGGFSAGKSTLLNTLIGRDLLPTAIRPETALATELHYSEVEYIDAFNEHNQAQRFELSQFEEINQNAADYTHLKAYLNCELLRALEPAVLVDMPGFESPLDLHNRAINYYLDKGCLYLALISCQDGTVTATMMRQLEKLDGYGCPFHIFISKTDLRPEAEVKAVVEEIQGQLGVAFLGQEIKVGTVSNKAVDQVQALLGSIDCNELFRRKYHASVQQLGEALVSELSLQAAVLEEQEQEKIDQAVRAMNSAIAELKRKQDYLTLNLESQFNLGQLQNEVVSRVELELRSNEDQIITQAIAGNLEAAQATFCDVVHAAVVGALNGKLEEIDQQIFAQYQEVMGVIDQELRSSCLSSVDFSAQVSQLVRTDFDLSRVVAQEPDGKMVTNLSTTVLQGLNFLSTLAGPLKIIVAGVLTVLQSVLPDILAKLWAKLNEDSLRAKASELMETVFIPQVLNTLRPQVQNLLTQEVRAKLTAVSKSFAQAVEEKRAAMNQIIEQSKSQAAEQQAQAQALKQGAAQIEALIQSLA
ncbi:MAG TPA: dynamin family protein [Candidatus Anaerobiospirillum stercoravium]|nr:dynamin family protein [Candidatus Anaerobiospirillum stercoravium]